jgi:tRNA-Thr(GGU) m(6)t(6)A37 methyltransferase TsaA
MNVGQPRPLSLVPVGHVESPLTDLALAPLQGDEGAPNAWLVFDARFGDAVRDLQVGDEMLLLTWLDRADREVLAVHPRGDRSRPLTGVFSTRSPDRPNPIGVHRVTIAEIRGNRLRVGNLEALDGTPVLDLKPVLQSATDR